MHSIISVSSGFVVAIISFNVVFKCTALPLSDTKAKKIIATTNPELTEIIECNGTPYVFKIPKIPQSFIQEFVKNQGHGYDEVLVEVEKYNYQHINYNPDGVSIKSAISELRKKLKLYSNNEINIL